MEIEGFTADFSGKFIWVYATDDTAWLPSEFLGSPNIRCAVLGSHGHTVLHTNSFDFTVRPTEPRSWNVLATILRSTTGTLELTWCEVSAPPVSFVSFLDGLSRSGLTITQVVIARSYFLNRKPDAIFFPPATDTGRVSDIMEIVGKLSSVGSGGSSSLDLNSVRSAVLETAKSGLGVVLTDVDGGAWKLYWHKPAESYTGDTMKRVMKQTILTMKAIGDLI